MKKRNKINIVDLTYWQYLRRGDAVGHERRFFYLKENTTLERNIDKILSLKYYKAYRVYHKALHTEFIIIEVKKDENINLY